MAKATTTLAREQKACLCCIAHYDLDERLGEYELADLARLDFEAEVEELSQRLTGIAAKQGHDLLDWQLVLGEAYGLWLRLLLDTQGENDGIVVRLPGLISQPDDEWLRAETYKVGILVAALERGQRRARGQP